MEELKDPAKRQTKSESKKEAKAEDRLLDIDESDYVPASNGARPGEEDSNAIPMAQREIILKEIAAFRDRSNRRERNKTWYEEEEKGAGERDYPSAQNDARRPTKAQDNHDDRRPLKPTNSQENIPLGPAADRRRGTRDFHQSVKFRAETDRYDRDDDEDIPDEEQEKRRLDRNRKDLELRFLDVCFVAFR